MEGQRLSGSKKGKVKIDACPGCGGEKIATSKLCWTCYVAKVKIAAAENQPRCSKCGAGKPAPGNLCRQCYHQDKRDAALQKQKRCSRCGSSGPFNKNRCTTDGLSRWCRKCDNETSTKYQQENPSSCRARKSQWTQDNMGRLKEKNKLWKKLNKDKVRDSNNKRRLIKLGTKASFTSEQWEAVKYFYGYQCLRCKKVEPEISLAADHVVPLSRGGIDSIDNIQPLCKSCNSKKHTAIMDFRGGVVIEERQLSLFEMR